jgi:large subunit ribosomal protein L10
MVGSELLSAADVAVLASLPSRETLLANLAGAISAPLQQLASLIQAVPRSFAYGLSALVEKRQAEGETLEVPAPGDEAAEAPPATEATASAEEAPAAESEPTADTDASAEAPTGEDSAESPA